MREATLRKNLAGLGIIAGPRNSEGWIGSHCPFKSNHPRGDQNPSFAAHINDSGFSGFNCFSCGEQGNILKLITLLGIEHGKDYSELYTSAALDEVLGFGEFDGVEIGEPEPELIDADQFEGMYVPVHRSALATLYLRNRGISAPAAKLLGLQYDSDAQRIMFPIYGATTEELYGFQGRSIIPAEKLRGPTHKNVPTGLIKSKLLLGLHLHKKNRPFFVVEGLFAVARLISIGALKHCTPVALMGNNMSKRQAEILIDSGEMVYLCLDDDLAGDVGLYGKLKNGEHAGGGAIDKLLEEVRLRLALYPRAVNDVDKFKIEHLQWILHKGHKKL